MQKIMKFYRKYSAVRWLFWLGVILPGIPFLLVSAGFILYMHWPRDYADVVNIAFDAKVEYVTLSAHGVNDTTTSWSDTLQQIMATTEQSQLNGLQQQHISLSWQPYSDNVFMCSVAGKKIGNLIGRKLANLTQLKAVHLVGHSCGSFVIYGVCQQLKAAKPSLVVQTTYLDPVSVYSGVDWQYGVDNFGRCADFSDTYIDTQDTVPGSNQVISHSYTFDVTPLRTRHNLMYPPHAWPTYFYLNALAKHQVPIYYNSPALKQHNYRKNIMNPWLFEY